jgi:polar amino acid transport system permease protein
MRDLFEFGPQLLAGVAVTLELALGALIFGLAFGLLGATAKMSSNPWVRTPATGILNLLRGLPEFLILLILYFGASQFLGDWAPGQFAAGVLALGIVFGAYSSETFRGAFLAVPAGQIEAGAAFGMTRVQVFFRIRLPQAWRFALPGIGNLWLALLKDTSLVSVLGLEEILRKANIGAQVTKHPFTFYLAAMGLYLLLTGASSPAFAWLERRAGRGVRR